MGNDIETKANLPGFNNLEENRKGKQMYLKIILPSKTNLLPVPMSLPLNHLP